MIRDSPRHFLVLLLFASTSLAILTFSDQDGAKQNSTKSTAEDSNVTFHYEANEFLVNKQQTNANKPKSSPNESKKSNQNADSSSARSRGGRMMDLDALVGDFAASQAIKERSLSGNRQSRYLSSPSIDVGGGKKLHIQGFIPIVGVKDVTEDESSSSSSNEQADQDQMAATRHQPKLQVANELPYGQSSIGHASFGVQRYLSNDQQQQQQQQQVDSKSSGGSMLDSLKKPLKLAGFSGTSSSVDLNQQQQQQNCLCVPFYMCKNGYISESGLAKSQVQQLIAQQQQQQSQPWNNKLLEQPSEMKTFQVPLGASSRPLVEQVQQQAAPVDIHHLIDERSFDQELVTMGSLTEWNESNNQTSQPAYNQTDLAALSDAAQQVDDNGLANATASGDYSQEILGRMLGLKSSSSRSSSSSVGVCGLLRTCCNIPNHLNPTQNDEKVIASNQPTALIQHNKYMQQQQPINKVYSQTDPSAQMLASQRYQQQVAPPQRLPYGYPTQMISRQQQMQMQPLNSLNMDTSLAHRSNQFQNRYQQVNQFTRGGQPTQALQSFQQPQQQVKMIPVPINPTSLNQQVALRKSQMSGQALGTRKILDGRCGLRQSAGISGRVQNLQYHESSADFGEYPAQAAILKRLPGSDSLFVCGGTLISQYWVATAAHCIKKHSQAELKVRLGEWDVHRDDEFYAHVEKEVRDLVIHPEFVAGNLVNDIALLRLDSPVDPSLPHVNPACLPNIDESFARQQCWVTGWGKDSFGQKGSFQAVLREVELPVISQMECEAALRQTRLGPHYRLHPGFICAGGEGGKDACEGDGGSGLYCIQDGVIKVAGLVSWGIGCGQAGVPGVYVNLAQYRPWIENIISIDEDIYSPHSNMISNNLISERSNSQNTSETTTTQSTPVNNETTKVEA